MRVLHLIETLGRGGAERLLVTLLPALAKQGVEPVVGVLKPPLDLAPELEARGIRVVTLPQAHKWNLPSKVGALRELCRTEGIELIHAHLYFPGIYAALLASRGGPPMVETFHNQAYAGANRAGLKLELHRLVRSALLRRGGSRFYGVSKAVADHYREALSLAQVAVMPNAIDMDAIETARATSPAHEDNRLHIVLPGRLVHEKGHADLIAALEGANLPPHRVSFLGGGPLEGRLHELGKDAGLDLDIVTGLDHPEFLSKLGTADIVVAPSRFEGFGIAAAEAMALGKPVIASDAGGLPEVIDDAGEMFPAGDTDALRSALEELAGDSGRQAELGRLGANRAASEFSSDAIAARLASEYKEVIAARSQ